MDEALFVLYARAWVSLNARGIDLWSDQQVISAFHILPPPSVSFTDWKANRFGEIPEPETPDPEPKPDIEHGPGWIAVRSEEGKKQVENMIEKLINGAKEIK